MDLRKSWRQSWKHCKIVELPSQWHAERAKAANPPTAAERRQRMREPCDAGECGWVLPKVTERRMTDYPTANF